MKTKTEARKDVQATGFSKELLCEAEQGDVEAQWKIAMCFEHGLGTDKDVGESALWYHAAADQGHVDAQYRLGKILEEEEDFKEAVSLYRKAASGGSSDAQLRLGMCLLDGHLGVEKNVDEALVWLRRASDQGRVRAHYGLGRYYDNVLQDWNEAYVWYEKASQRGHLGSLYKMGVMHEHGRGPLKPDLEKALQFFQRAANGGNLDALYRLGCAEDHFTVWQRREWLQSSAERGHLQSQYKLFVMLRGKGEVPSEESIKWCTLAADQGYANAQFELGMYLLLTDVGKGSKWILDAALQGHAGAQFHYGFMLAHGKMGEPKNEALALDWYMKAAKQGYVRAERAVGVSLFFGRGCTMDYATAVEWFKKASDHGCEESANLLGYCYHNGYGVPQDEVEATICFQKAARAGDANAQYNFGVNLRRGKGAPQDLVTSFKWFHLSALKGFPASQYEVGVSYEGAQGVEKDVEKAFQWYLLSARSGYAKAFYKVALCYDYGVGVGRDENEAKVWCQKAAASGNADASFMMGCYAEDDQVAMQYFQSAARQGHSAAICEVGMRYHFGIGVEKNEARATRWWTRQAVEKTIQARTMLAFYGMHGRGNVARMPQKAMEFYEFAQRHI